MYNLHFCSQYNNVLLPWHPPAVRDHDNSKVPEEVVCHPLRGPYSSQQQLCHSRHLEHVAAE